MWIWIQLIYILCNGKIVRVVVVGRTVSGICKETSNARVGKLFYFWIIIKKKIIIIKDVREWVPVTLSLPPIQFQREIEAKKSKKGVLGVRCKGWGERRGRGMGHQINYVIPCNQKSNSYILDCLCVLVFFFLFSLAL